MNNKKVLVVDDDADFAYILSLLLQYMGYEPSVISSGRGIAAVIRELKPFAVIVDMMLPGIDGMDLSVQVKDMDRNILVIMVSAMCVGHEMNIKKPHAADHVLCKPVDKEELKRILESGNAA
ncbi:MAG: response regulator [Oligoflexia bacterium]|nr:response regulator [Oligoflexia bacterium]